MKQVVIYTDGACSCNPGPGGWGAILMYKSKRKEISGYNSMTTNNKMELTAVIKALRAARKHKEIEIHTDSQYVKNGMQSWIKNWKKNNWKTADKKPVKNRELWQELDELASVVKIHWVWVKGHAGEEFNERVDDLARGAAESYK